MPGWVYCGKESVVSRRACSALQAPRGRGKGEKEQAEGEGAQVSEWSGQKVPFPLPHLWALPNYTPPNP